MFLYTPHQNCPEIKGRKIILGKKNLNELTEKIMQTAIEAGTELWNVFMKPNEIFLSVSVLTAAIHSDIVHLLYGHSA